MLIAPFSVPTSAPARTALLRPSRSFRPPTKTLSVWLIGGLAILLLVPAARGGATLGGTLPFWLVAAPLIDLAWIQRRHIARCALAFFRNSPRRRAMALGVRRQRGARSAACSMARS